MQAARLSERKKADRARMATMLAEIVTNAGGNATIEEQPYGDMCPRMIMVRIAAPGGARVNVDFDGESCQPDVFLLSWHIDTNSDDRFNPAYWRSINEIHHSKATVIANGFSRLCQFIAQDVAACVDGRAYSEELKARHIAKEGTAAERNARFASWRDELAAGKESVA